MEKNMDTNFDFNKTEKFDFSKVGKRMPYSTPDDFFKDMEANILEQVKDDKPKPVRIQPKKRPLMKVIWTAAIAVAEARESPSAVSPPPYHQSRYNHHLESG